MVSGDANENQVLQLAASLNQNSAHPLSKAVLDRFATTAQTLLRVDEFDNISGKGIKGIIDGATVLLGNEKLLELFHIAIPEDIKAKAIASQQQAKTVSYLAKGENVLAVLNFSDPLKPTSKEAVTFLQQQGIEVIMMTGDNESTAKACLLYTSRCV